jgi:hypothetical protein
MLTDEEAKRIRSEESYRADIRKELGLTLPYRKTKAERIWQFLNSSFALWFLSAVLVSGLGTVYTAYQTAISEKAKSNEARVSAEKRREDLVDKLDIEISYRLSATLSKLSHAQDRFDQTEVSARLELVSQALEPLVPMESSRFPSLFPEFEKYSGLALIAELRRHVSDGEQENLKEVLAKTSGIVHEVAGNKTKKLISATVVAGQLLKAMHDARWDIGFYYTDCSAQAPFC